MRIAERGKVTAVVSSTNAVARSPNSACISAFPLTALTASGGSRRGGPRWQSASEVRPSSGAKVFLTGPTLPAKEGFNHADYSTDAI